MRHQLLNAGVDILALIDKVCAGHGEGRGELVDGRALYQLDSKLNTRHAWGASPRALQQPALPLAAVDDVQEVVGCTGNTTGARQTRMSTVMMQLGQTTHA